MFVEMSVDQDPFVPSEPSLPGLVDAPPISRKISIIDGFHGHDNLAFESPNRSRKVSANSDHAEFGPVRKKSILHNAHAVPDIGIVAG